MKKMIALVMLVAFAVAPTSAFAASPWTEGDTYADKVTGKLEFGIKNLLGGWTELYTQPADAENKFSGFGKGLVNAIVYTLGGAIHTATFPIPVDVPIPNNGLDM